VKTEVFIQKTSNLFVENRLLKFVIVVLAFAVSFNSFMVYRAVKYQRVVLIPPKMTGTVEFVQGKPTDKYLRDISRRIATLATSYSPPTARAQFEELLSYFAPESYPDASKLGTLWPAGLRNPKSALFIIWRKLKLETTLSKFLAI